jgi:hypothetical protein
MLRRLQYAYSRLEKHAYARGLLSPRRLVLPDFLGIGAQKAGTTWLYENLRRHPGLYMPDRKELHYFDWYFHRSLRWYAGHFKAGAQKVCGEITPGYSILSRERIAFVHKLMPGLRLILLIRNPIERAWSQALMNLVTLPRRRYEDVSAGEFREHFRSNRSLRRGDYLAALENWLSFFPAAQLFVGVYDDISGRPQELLTDVFEHLGVSTDVDWGRFPLEDVVFRGAGVPLPDSLRSVLHGIYENDLRRLVDRFGDRVAHWR